MRESYSKREKEKAKEGESMKPLNKIENKDIFNHMEDIKLKCLKNYANYM